MQTILRKTRASEHANCVVCSPSNQKGLGLDFTRLEDGSVQAGFCLDGTYEGYENFLHGGMIAVLLDGAMTNCTFAHGYRTVTVQINIRFLHPVKIDEPGTVRAWIARSSSLLHVLKAQVIQGQQVKANAIGKFMKPPFK